MLLAAASLTLLLAPALTASAQDQPRYAAGITMQAPSPGSTYKVQDGDSLYSIAADMGIADSKVSAWIDDFLALNDMSDADALVAGKTVKIPGRAASTSSSSPSSVASSAGAGGSRSYTVQNGDTLYSIGANLNVPDDKLYQWVQATIDLNGWEDGNALTAGKTIQISTKNVPVPKPITSSYTVKPGDTLSDIASKNNVPDSGMAGWTALVLELNGLSSPNLLREGQTLQLPVTSGSGGGVSTTTTTTSSTTTTSTTGPSPTSQNVSLSRISTTSTVSYTVKAGDTLQGIAIAQKVPDTQVHGWIDDVLKLNKLKEDGFITEGQKLDLPALSVTPPASSTTTTTTTSTDSSTANPPRPPAAASSSSSTSTSTTTTSSPPASTTNSTSSTNSTLANAPRSMTGCFYVIKSEDDMPGIAKKVGIESGKVDGWIAQVKQMNGVDFKVMPVGTAIQLPC